MDNTTTTTTTTTTPGEFLRANFLTWPWPPSSWKLVGNFLFIIYLTYFWFTTGPLTSQQRWRGIIFYLLIFMTLAMSYCPSAPTPTPTPTSTIPLRTLAVPVATSVGCTVDYLQRVVNYATTILHSPLWLLLIALLAIGPWLWPSLFTRQLELIMILVFYLYHLGQNDEIPPLPLLA